MKHLAQLLGDDFIRITATTLLPFRHIKVCKDNVVIMKKMPWQEEAIAFKLESHNQEQIEEKVTEGIMTYRAKAGKKKKDSQENSTSGHEEEANPTSKRCS